MGIRQDEGSDSSNDVARVTRETTARLGALGIFLDGRETAEELVQVADAVERFERLVELRGGDLMVDEGSGRTASEPDDSHFATPVRREHETIAAYLERLARATDEIRRHRPLA